MRQLMENELLGAGERPQIGVHHPRPGEASAGRPRGGALAGPESHVIGDYPIDLPRPRDVAEIRLVPRFIEIHAKIWHAMKEEVLKGYERQQRQ
jgi:NitT/TauT family transport system ATP-binding protein